MYRVIYVSGAGVENDGLTSSRLDNGLIWYTVDLVIFACLNFREILILGFFTKFRIRKFSLSLVVSVACENTIYTKKYNIPWRMKII